MGGFFASLKLITDEDSFKKGVGILEGFPKLLGKTAMGAIGLGVAFVGLGAATANSMTKLAATAKQLGMNAMMLDNWQNAVRLAGGDADSFTSSVQSMNEAFRNLKIGEVKEDFIKATGMSGADFGKLQGMNNDQRLRTIWSALEKVQDPGKQQALIQRIFGQGGVDLFSRMQLQGTSLSQLYSQAAAMNPNTQADYNAAIKGNQANESIMVSFENTIKKLGIEIEKALLPAVQGLAQWLRDNKEALNNFAIAVGDITSKIISLGGIFSSNEKSRESAMIGGDVNLALFNEIKRARGIEKGSAVEGTTFLGLMFDQDWKKMTEKAKSMSGSGMSPEALAAKIFQENEADKIRSLFPKNIPDSILASIYEGRERQSNDTTKQLYTQLAQSTVQRAEIELKVNGKSLSSVQSQQIIDALSTAGIISVRR